MTTIWAIEHTITRYCIFFQLRHMIAEYHWSLGKLSGVFLPRLLTLLSLKHLYHQIQCSTTEELTKLDYLGFCRCGVAVSEPSCCSVSCTGCSRTSVHTTEPNPRPTTGYLGPGASPTLPIRSTPVSFSKVLYLKRTFKPRTWAISMIRWKFWLTKSIPYFRVFMFILFAPVMFTITHYQFVNLIWYSICCRNSYNFCHKAIVVEVIAEKLLSDSYKT